MPDIRLSRNRCCRMLKAILYSLNIKFSLCPGSPRIPGYGRRQTCGPEDEAAMNGIIV